MKNPLANISHKELTEQIGTLAKDLSELPQLDIPIVHHFSKSVYAREMQMPKDSIVVGKIHKHQNMCIISKGEVSVLSIDGLVRLKAPCTFVASPGAQRVIYAHEDTVFTVIHGTDETDLEKIEDEFVAKDFSEIQLTEKDIKLLKGENL